MCPYELDMLNGALKVKCGNGWNSYLMERFF